MAVFTNTSRNKLTWQAPTTVQVGQDYFLDIGSGYNLLINDTNKLIIQPGQAGTTWTPLARKKFTF